MYYASIVQALFVCVFGYYDFNTECLFRVDPNHPSILMLLKNNHNDVVFVNSVCVFLFLCHVCVSVCECLCVHLCVRQVYMS